MVDAEDIGCLYFKASEFKKANPSCDWQDMDFAFLAMLDKARDIAGTPFVINSAFRSKEYEISKGRSGSSSHCKGCAIDIRCSTSSQRLRIVFGAFVAGFRRIGIGEHFIHFDCDSSKPEGIWLY